MAHAPGPSRSGAHYGGTPAQASSEPNSYSASLLDGERVPLLVPEDLENGLAVQYRYGSPNGAREGLRERAGKGEFTVYIPGASEVQAQLPIILLQRHFFNKLGTSSPAFSSAKIRIRRVHGALSRCVASIMFLDWTGCPTTRYLCKQSFLLCSSFMGIYRYVSADSYCALLIQLLGRLGRRCNCGITHYSYVHVLCLWSCPP